MKKQIVMLMLACAGLSACETAADKKIDAEINAAVAADEKKESETNQAQTILNSEGNSGWSQVKVFSRQGNYAVFKGPDGSFRAIDVSKVATGETRDQLLSDNASYTSLQYSVYSYQSYDVVSSTTVTGTSCTATGSGSVSSCSLIGTDSAGTSTYNITIDQSAWVTHNEDIYTDPTSGLIFDIGASGSKDLEAVAATMNAVSVNQVRQNLVASYGLSEDRAQQLASLASSWQNISKTRAMTARDLKEFQVKALGTDLGSITTAAKKASNGDNKDYNALMQKAAQLNDISPEQAKSIIKNFM